MLRSILRLICGFLIAAIVIGFLLYRFGGVSVRDYCLLVVVPFVFVIIAVPAGFYLMFWFSNIANRMHCAIYRRIKGIPVPKFSRSDAIALAKQVCVQQFESFGMSRDECDDIHGNTKETPTAYVVTLNGGPILIGGRRFIVDTQTGVVSPYRRSPTSC